jgi:hypothetical protein
MNSTTTMRLMIWNDNSQTAKLWAGIARDDGFAADRIDTVTTKNIDEVVDRYLEKRPDVVVLDLIDDDNGKPIGRDIAMAIQRVDALAPLVVLTRKPGEAYVTGGYLKWSGFAGIYPADIIDTRGQFRDVVVIESLISKHLLQPDYALARQCTLLIGAFKGWNSSTQAVVDLLKDTIQSLPSARTSEVWHSLMTEAVASALRARGWKDVEARYIHASDLFRRSDPYYMAGTSSRKHLSHNVQVCLLGLSLLLADGPIREAAISASGDLLDAMLIWCCIGTVHDAAYLSERLETISADLAELAGQFGQYLGKPKPTAWPWPTTSHSIVAGKMWDPGTLKGKDAEVCEMIAQGILRHDVKTAGGKKVPLERWHEFLAVLCDELQDWQRYRPEAKPGKDAPWRLVEPLRIEISKETGGRYTISLELMVVDHSMLIQERGGSPDIDPVGKRFDEIARTLENHLVSSTRLQVSLQAHFVTRVVPSLTSRAELDKA